MERPNIGEAVWHYFDRKGTATICASCATERWGDESADDEREAREAFNARYYDESGDWCAAPYRAGDVPCDGCKATIR